MRLKGIYFAKKNIKPWGKSGSEQNENQEAKQLPIETVPGLYKISVKGLN